MDLSTEVLNYSGTSGIYPTSNEQKKGPKIPDLFFFFFKPSLSLCSAVNSFMQFAEGFSQANMRDKPALKTQIVKQKLFSSTQI